MAERKFVKNCPEWLMFQDFYRFVQMYYLPENMDDYWLKCIESVREYHEKYKGIPISKHLVLGFLNYAEEVLKGSNEKEWTCPACGKFRNPHDKFCRNCGAKIGGEND